jgi:hypothetical protein
MLNAGRKTWSVGDKVLVYRTRTGDAGLIGDEDRRDYDVEHYARVLRDTFAARMERAFPPEDFDVVFGDGDQLSLFGRPIGEVRTLLRSEPREARSFS